MEISSNLSDTGIEGADNFGNTIEKIALSVKSGNIAFEINNVFANSVEFSIVFSTSDLLPEEEKKEWTISVALIFTMTLNSNSGLEFNVVEFTKEHSKYTGRSRNISSCGCISCKCNSVNYCFIFSWSRYCFWFVDSSAVNCKRIKETMARGSIL